MRFEQRPRKKRKKEVKKRKNMKFDLEETSLEPKTKENRGKNKANK